MSTLRPQHIVSSRDSTPIYGGCSNKKFFIKWKIGNSEKKSFGSNQYDLEVNFDVWIERSIGLLGNGNLFDFSKLFTDDGKMRLFMGVKELH